MHTLFLHRTSYSLGLLRNFETDCNKKKVLSQ